MCDQQSLRLACTYAQSDQSLCTSLEYSMIVKLLTEHHLEFLSLKRGCRGSSESTHVKIPHCWKSHVLAHFIFTNSADVDEQEMPHSMAFNVVWVFTVCHNTCLQVSSLQSVYKSTFLCTVKLVLSGHSK